MRFRKDSFIWITILVVASAGATFGDDLPAPVPATGDQPKPEKPKTRRHVPTPARAPVSALAPDGELTPKMQPQSVTVLLINDTTITGTISEDDQWTMKTTFGTASLPLSAVAGIRMAQEGNTTTTVVLHNGDSITGALQLNEVVVQTDWGRAEIFGTHVASILFSPGLKWTSEPGLNGVRWKLAADESRPTPSAQTAATVAARSPRSKTAEPARPPSRP